MFNLERIRHAINRPSQALHNVLAKLKIRFFFTGIYRTTEINYLIRENTNSQIMNRETIFDSATIEFKTKDGILRHTFTKREMITLKNVFVNLESGLVYVKYHDEKFYRVIKESSEWPSSHNIFFPSPHHKNVQPLDGDFALSFTKNGFYHEMSEDLPNSLMIPKEKTFLVRNKLANFEFELVAKFFEKKYISQDSWILLPQLTFISRGEDVGYIHPENLWKIRNEFFINKVEKNPTKYLYVSRKNSRRGLINESQIEKILADSGFEIIYAEDFTIEQQRRIFSDAKVIAGPHGAGLFNGVWATSAKLIEIMDPNNLNRCFEWQSLIARQEYIRLINRPGLGSIRQLAMKIVSEAQKE